MQMCGIGSNASEDIHENNISVMWVGWILHHFLKTMVLVNPGLYSWTFFVYVAGCEPNQPKVLRAAFFVVLLNDKIGLSFSQT